MWWRNVFFFVCGATLFCVLASLSIATLFGIWMLVTTLIGRLWLTDIIVVITGIAVCVLTTVAVTKDAGR